MEKRRVGLTQSVSVGKRLGYRVMNTECTIYIVLSFDYVLTFESYVETNRKREIYPNTLPSDRKINL